MRTNGSRRTTVIVAAAGLAAGTLLTTSAATSASATTASDPATISTAMAMKLGSSSAGSYLDSATGRMVVTITNSADAQAVRDAGATPRVVARSGAELGQIKESLDRNGSALPAGTSWGADVTTNQVVIWADESVKGAKLKKVQKEAAKYGDAVRMEKEKGTYDLRIRGGDPIYTGGARCSLGFNVRNSSGTRFFVTAGHCTNIGSTWTNRNGTVLGTRAGTSFPTNDYGIVRYTNTSIATPGTVNLYSGTQDITRSANAVVGQSAARSGSTTGLHRGTVTALNQTVRYAEGTVYQMIRTNICAEPGDSGGSLFSGTTALGLTSGGSGNCSSGGTTFFQPVREALSRYSVSVY